MHWLYRVIPRRRPGLLLFVPWALFGNDEDGIFAERTSVAGFSEQTLWTAVRWWLRNPCHNLTHHVIALPLWFAIPIIGKSASGFWPDGRVFLALNVLPFVSFRAGGWEGYFGFRPRVVNGLKRAVFGVALRKSKG